MKDSKILNIEPGFSPRTEMEEGITDGGENVQYLFPGVRVVEVKELNVTNPQRREDVSSSLGSMDSEGSADFPSKGEPGKPRAAWGGKLEFMLTMIGYAVGLGNVWRFPYLCYKNGGGAFLLPYCIMLAVVGLPLFYMELSLGQFASLGPITVWRLNPLLKGLGYSMVIVSWLIGLYYNVVIAHVLYYLYSSFTSVLPWTTCTNSWNTVNCLAAESSGTYLRNDTLNATIDSTTPGLQKENFTTRTPSEEYYRFGVLAQTDSIDDYGTVQWHLVLSLFIAWLLVFLVLLKGIKSLGKVVYFTAIFPYIMLTVLFIRGVTLPGAGDGILYYLKPDFERLLDPRVWSDAATQIFYSLSACSGGIIAMASYNKFNNNCYRDALIVCVINCGTSVFAGMVIFSVLGFMALEKGVDIKDVADDGPGLAFVVYPEALARMPVAPMWAVFFFIMMATLGFGSEFSIIECVLSALGDEFPIVRKQRRYNIIFRGAFVVLAFLLGIPMVCSGGIYLLNLVDYSVGGFPLLVVGLLELIAVNWIYGLSKFSDNIKMMLGKEPGKYWVICWKYVSPLVISITIVMNVIMYKEPDLDGIMYPGWAKSLGWLIAMFPIVVIPAWFLYKYCHIGGFKLMTDSMKPLPSWGPASQSKEYLYADVEININGPNSNPALARLMGSTVSNTTTITDYSPASSTMNLIRTKSPSESNV